ncbi:hypothetical protein H0H92_015668 [Tricholoma furcatifolium]|nr:hypothetical protein H0H92_015668 [Tricholoma furcatifolium]
MLSTQQTSQQKTASMQTPPQNENKGDASNQNPIARRVRMFVRKGNAGDAKEVSVDYGNFEEALQQYTECAQMALSVLDELSSVHPFIALPVMAFKLVVTLNLKRRDNNAKVLAVKVQMQSMMSVLVQLKNVEDPNEIGPDGKTLPGRLQTLMEEIAEYIKKCASGCDLYLNKSSIKKYLKSSIYEGRLAEYANGFADFETKLHNALTVHIARNVDAVVEKLDKQDAILSDIQSQMRELFLSLDTPREKEIRRIIDRGGATSCIGNDKDLQALIDRSPEDSKLVDLKGRQSEIALGNLKKTLQKELAEDVESALQQNLVRFNGKLDLQERELQGLHAAISSTGDKIMAALSRGSHDYIIDPHALQKIREIWAEMSWKGTVKSRHFVLALRDYFMNGQKVWQSPISSASQIQSPPPTSLDTPEKENIEFPAAAAYIHDEWAELYIDVTYLRAISEAIDDDGSGFINIQEVNTFTTTRPEGWS